MRAAGRAGDWVGERNRHEGREVHGGRNAALKYSNGHALDGPYARLCLKVGRQ